MAELDRIEKLVDGTLQIRWKKADGGWHRTSIAPDMNADRMLDAVDIDLKTSLNDSIGVKTTDRDIIKVERDKGVK